MAEQEKRALKNHTTDQQQEARLLLAFTQHTLTHAPIELHGESQQGLYLLLDEIQKRMEG